MVPSEVAERFDTRGRGSGLVELLKQTRDELENDVQALKELEVSTVTAGHYGLAQRSSKVVTTLDKRELLGCLSNHKYCPSTGTRWVQSNSVTDYGKSEHDVEKLVEPAAISPGLPEYVPGSQIVAGGRVWAARGAYRMPGREPEPFRYGGCEVCGATRRSHGDVDPICDRGRHGA